MFCRSAGSSIVTGLKAGYDHITSDHADKEKIVGLHFGFLEVERNSGDERVRVLVLLYEIGFQLWSIDGDVVKEVVSRREDPIRSVSTFVLHSDSHPTTHTLRHESFSTISPMIRFMHSCLCSTILF